MFQGGTKPRDTVRGLGVGGSKRSGVHERECA